MNTQVFSLPPKALSRILNRSCALNSMDFQKYNERFLWRRVLTRMMSKNLNDFSSYCHYLRTDVTECKALISALSIRLSCFMRDEHAFNALEKLTLTPMIKRIQQEKQRTITLWSAGCSSGEEPYSLAILLTKLIGKEIGSWKIHLDATDTNAELIRQAQAAVYKKTSFHNLDADYIDAFFTFQNGAFYLNSPLRTLVSWHSDNISKPPPNFLYDVILCRNVLFYYTKQYQQHLVKHIIDHLKPEGYLMLGMAETLPMEEKKRLAPVSENYRIYQRLSLEGGTNAT